ncbi:MAG: DNA repair protein RecO [Acidimicrobiales bacterium]|jgi:DNA repair protein RecO (recombination protein O)
MSLYREHGIVLRTYKLGEADRIVVFVTRGHGKVRAVAKGVRKTKSRFGSRLEPGSHVALQLYEGRELDIVTQAESVDHFRAIRDDLDRLAGAQVMLEATDQVSQEHEPDARLYQLLLGALRTLAGSGSPLVVPAFLLKLLAADGVQPLVEICASCGEDTPLVAFDLGAGGLLCRSCRSGVAVSPDAVSLLQDVLGGRLNAALAEPASEATREVTHLATSAMEHHLERRLRTVDALDHA